MKVHKWCNCANGFIYVIIARMSIFLFLMYGKIANSISHFVIRCLN
jgi:hypothetical protein